MMEDLTPVESAFLEAWSDFAREVYDTAESKGWHEESSGNLYVEATKLALIGVEVSESIQKLREGNPLDEKIQMPAVSVELADVIIRVMDLDIDMFYNLGRAVIAKARYNKTRPYKHNRRF